MQRRDRDANRPAPAPPVFCRVVRHEEDALALAAQQCQGLGDVGDSLSIQPDDAVAVEEECVVAAIARGGEGLSA